MKNLLVIGNKAFQKEKIFKLGIIEAQYCDSKCENAEVWLDKKTGGIGADVFFECVGKNETCSLAINHAAPGGKVCLVGNPYSDMLLDKQDYWKILRNQLTVTGTWNSSFTGVVTDDWHMVVYLLKEKKIDPAQFISHCYRLEELDRGFEIMRDKSEDYIKIMAVTGYAAKVELKHFRRTVKQEWAKEAEQMKEISMDFFRDEVRNGFFIPTAVKL